MFTKRGLVNVVTPQDSQSGWEVDPSAHACVNMQVSVCVPTRWEMKQASKTITCPHPSIITEDGLNHAWQSICENSAVGTCTHTHTHEVTSYHPDVHTGACLASDETTSTDDDFCIMVAAIGNGGAK